VKDTKYLMAMETVYMNLKLPKKKLNNKQNNKKGDNTYEKNIFNFSDDFIMQRYSQNMN